MNSAKLTKQKGFSLIELMLALALGVVVTSGIVQLFVGNSQTYNLLNGQARMQENARFALDFISHSARLGGYMGCDPDADKIINTLGPIPNNNWNTLFEFNITQSIEVFDGQGGGNFNPAAVSLPQNLAAGGSVNTHINGNGIDMAEVDSNADILVLRHVEAPGGRISQVISPSANPTVLDAGAGLNFQVDEIVAINNCEQAAVFKITAVANAAGVTTLSHGAGGAGNFSNVAGSTLSAMNFPYGNAADAQGTTVGHIQTEIYYLATDANRVNNLGNPIKSLWRKTGAAAPVELIQGIEDFQVLLGVDTTPTNDLSSVNRYVLASAVPVNSVVRTIRIMVVASSVDAVTADNQLLQRTFTQTINLRNG
ncbi:MAG: PilW family protein [Pseudomonadales bacterium]|nr:PilW family protein [Pseudomonadales bacterium]